MMGDINLFRVDGSVWLKRVKSKSEVSKDDNCDGYLIESSEKEIRRIVESLKGSGMKIGVVGGDDAFNRRVVESLRVDYLVSPERERPRVAGVSGCRGVGVSGKTDTLKQRDSGINHVVAKLARDKGIVVVVDMNEVSRLKGKELALRLARIMQNVMVCRKAGCGIRIGSFGSGESEVVDELGRRAFGVSLGMSSKQSADSVKT